MTAYEIMLSESQERMLMVLRPGAEDMARAVFEKWELDFAVIGRLTDDGRLTVRRGGIEVAAIPVRPWLTTRRSTIGPGRRRRRRRHSRTTDRRWRR